MKKIITITVLLLFANVLSACSSTKVSRETSNPITSQNESDSRDILTEKDTKENNKTMGDDYDGIEIDTTNSPTMEKLIEQLKKDGIVSGTATDIEKGVEGALRTTQIGDAVIVEFDTKTPEAYFKANASQTIRFKNKEYKVIAVNTHFMLILLDDTKADQAATSFSRYTADDDRIIHFSQ